MDLSTPPASVTSTTPAAMSQGPPKPYSGRAGGWVGEEEEGGNTLYTSNSHTDLPTYLFVKVAVEAAAGHVRQVLGSGAGDAKGP